MQDAYMLDFAVGEIRCQLTTIAPEYKRRNGSTYYRHRHPAFEFHHVFKGTCSFKIGSQNYNVNEGQAILIAPALYHSIKSISPDVSKICIGFEICRAAHRYRDQTVEAIDAAFHSVRAVVLDMGHASEILEKIRLVAEKDIDQFIEREELKALSALLILELAKKFTGQQTESSTEKAQIAIQRNYIIDEFFNQNFHLSDGVAQLAELLCVSNRQLDRILKELCGLSYRQKLKEIRLEISLDLLTTTDKSIAEIAELTGYSSPANFSTFIKSACGKTPSEIRKGEASTDNQDKTNGRQGRKYGG